MLTGAGRYEIARQSLACDVVLHLGDQVYNKGEDSDKTCELFGEATTNNHLYQLTVEFATNLSEDFTMTEKAPC